MLCSNVHDFPVTASSTEVEGEYQQKVDRRGGKTKIMSWRLRNQSQRLIFLLTITGRWLQVQWQEFQILMTLLPSPRKNFGKLQCSTQFLAIKFREGTKIGPTPDQSQPDTSNA